MAPSKAPGHQRHLAMGYYPRGACILGEQRCTACKKLQALQVARVSSCRYQSTFWPLQKMLGDAASSQKMLVRSGAAPGTQQTIGLGRMGA